MGLWGRSRGRWPATAASWQLLARSVWRRFVGHQVLGQSAQMSFYFFLSVFPILLILTGMLGLFLDANWLVRDSLLDRIGSVAPPSVVRLLDQVLEHLTGRGAQPVGWGVGLTLWAASSGMTATSRGLNVAYGVREERVWWKRRLVALGLTLVLMLLLRRPCCSW